ncbi:MAG: hypothetical protein JSR12_01885 [Bacteroidetes bacterium]|nr:hypothetical protein [Bacteroidota bacterium]
MKKLLLIGCLFLSVKAFSQDNYEIQVYGSQTQAPHSSIFELHSNYTFVGEQNIVNGVRPSYHALHETLEVTTGVTKTFEIGFYLFSNYTSPYGYQFVGTHIRPRIMAPTEWHLPVGLSLSAEFGYQRPEYSDETWNFEIRPIIDKTIGKFYASFNPTLGIAIQSVEGNHTPVFEPNIKASYQFFKKAFLGIEYYGSQGPINNFYKLSNQSHAIYFAYDLTNVAQWELNIGPGWGLTKATDGFVFKILVGRRINWSRKNNAHHA